MARFSYLDVGAILGQLHGIAPDKVAAFQARLKHLQKLGFPPGVNTGKGRPAVYSFEAFCQLIAVLEMIQIGLLPARAALVVIQNWRWGKITLAAALIEIQMFDAPRGGRFGDSWLWMLLPEAMRDLTDQGEKIEDYSESISFLRLQDLEKFLWQENWDEEHQPILGEKDRVAFINVTSVLRRAVDTMSPMQVLDSLVEARTWFGDDKAVDDLRDKPLLEYSLEDENGDDT